MQSITQQKKKAKAGEGHGQYPKEAWQAQERRGEDQAIHSGDTETAGCRKDEWQLQELTHWGLEGLQVSSAQHEM
jgi:hypothetical protein